MAWAEVVKWDAFDAVAAIAQQIRESAPTRTISAAVPAIVPDCRCGGECRCGTLVPYLLHRQLELECEFYREVH